jgi:hypothetical protein
MTGLCHHLPGSAVHTPVTMNVSMTNCKATCLTATMAVTTDAGIGPF